MAVPRPFHPVVLVLGLALGATPLRAQISADSLGWRFLGSAGYVQTSGNSQLSTVNLSDRLIFRPSTRWQFGQSATWTYGKTGGVESANQLLGRLRADYYLTTSLSAYGLAGYERNRYAGIASRWEEAAGLSWQAVRSARNQVDLEAGVSYNSQKSTASTLDNFVASRFAGRYRYSFTPATYLEESAELLSNLQQTGDQRLISLTSLVAPISSNIGIRVSYLMRYDSQPAETATPGVFFKKLDTTLSTGLQFSF